MVTEISDQTFNQETDKGLVITDFSATWCPPCQMLKPVINNLAEQYDGKVKFTSMDVDENQQVPAAFGIQGIPTLVVKKDGKVIAQLVGFRPEPLLKAQLEKYLAE
ncbi:thioredoxin [Furfurilactobacillus rossiae]|uniref:Thioredoxin n=1 Tax=Furfurilactobacillus rossiae DSM 15814 TaxID=1114972 RepID=A0A0R1RDD6_9LACO|nr:thioredoxin [Furfurilactobacillus rossiae]KRL55069.1 hypothetical protein FD35_GL002525 [Furfurilactobacillus rossiae DSM 15814]QFR67717.1 thioredoxin [Furfurilactobacillus rossiae]QLE60683.1 Thioredoxin [Furfurilactobacillus rossiae]